MTGKLLPFRSETVSAAVEETAAKIADANLQRIFRQCATNTLDTTVVFRDGDPPDTYVITGDVPAMWLRDSSAQVWPYLRFAAADARLADMIGGLIRRHSRCIVHDPYANAFLYDASDRSEWAGDRTDMRPGVHERKYEVGSLCHAIRLSHGYWKATQRIDCFDTKWCDAMRRILEVWRIEQDHDLRSSYRFERPGSGDSLANGGLGSRTARTGMTWSGFRPSDDRCEYHYLVPSQAFAMVSLARLCELATDLGETDLAKSAHALSVDIARGFGKHATVSAGRHGQILAYEVDGSGDHLLMDDANVPSLLSLPYLGFCRKTDEPYASTRKFVLGDGNPFFVRGRYAEGIGSPHTPRGRVWPMSIVMQALTSSSEGEIVRCLGMLARLHAGTYLMHESVDPNDPSVYSRAWFAWANSMFGELIFTLADRHPNILARQLA